MTNQPWGDDTEAMHNWLAKPQLTDDLGDLDMDGDIETDSTVLAEQFHMAFNVERKLYRQNLVTSECAQPYGDFARERAASLERRHYQGQARGLPEAEAEDFTDELAALRNAVMARHRAARADDDLAVIDPRRAEGGHTLPIWDVDNPVTANVIRGVIASHPHRLYVLRGAFGPQELAQLIYDGDIATRCNVGASPLCDPKSPTARDTGGRPIWGMFTLASGPHVVYYTICRPCYWEFFHSEHNQIGYDSFDPKFDNADDWNFRHG